jgi:hypothetical protein
MSRVRVKIGHIVLRGLDPADRQPLLDGLKSELSRLLANRANEVRSARLRHMPVLYMRGLSSQPGASGANKLGGAIARGIGSGVKR